MFQLVLLKLNGVQASEKGTERIVYESCRPESTKNEAHIFLISEVILRAGASELSLISTSKSFLS